jgi:hypothetical protein
LNPTIFVLEDKTEEINDIVKQTTYNQKTSKRFLRSSARKKIMDYLVTNLGMLQEKAT